MDNTENDYKPPIDQAEIEILENEHEQASSSNCHEYEFQGTSPQTDKSYISDSVENSYQILVSSSESLSETPQKPNQFQPVPTVEQSDNITESGSDSGVENTHEENVNQTTTPTSNNIFYRIIRSIKNIPSSMWQCVQLGIAFYFVFVGYSPTQNILATIHPDDAAIVLGIVYASFSIGSLIAPIIVKKMGLLKALSLAAFTYAMFVYCAIEKLNFLFIPAGAVVGIGAGLLWTSQGVYLNRICPNESELGKYSGVFMAIFTMGGITGNAIVGTMTTTKALSVTYILIILGSSSLFGCFIIMFLRQAHAKVQKPPSTLLKTIKGIKTTFLDRKFHFIIPLGLLQGQSQAYFYITLPNMIGLERIGYMMVIFGVVSVVGSFCWGRLIDRYGKEIAAKILASLVCVSIGISLVVVFFDTIFMFYILMAINSSYDSLQTILLFNIISTTFPDSPYGFAASRVFQALFTAIGFFTFKYLPFFFILGWLGVIALLMTCSVLYLLRGIKSGKWKVAPPDEEEDEKENSMDTFNEKEQKDLEYQQSTYSHDSGYSSEATELDTTYRSKRI
ncbi:hypothetical protein DLAC_08543 [Tieghemostelium lacteum]|uniref:Major facilitator superfamily (MFS) profile domain-containing protein n=1 Tax=Tieghemostelium lacteum TaxID=361077 RepID=A0A151Z7N0_TIELA|nr:hypothetical protein DLAC_08543 [Tieghemostelium lacteum]|eukprot:KYQ89973.1 hypothetical protein DLAC_08543 [Tieghemostelium lacteum]